MSSLALLKETGGGPASARAHRLEQMLISQSARNLRQLPVKGGTLLLADGPAMADSLLLTNADGSVRAAASGVVLYRGLVQEAALDRLQTDWHQGRLEPKSLAGGFVAVLNDQERCVFLTDPIGNLPVYSLADGSAHATSFLGLCHLADQLTLIPQSAAEYVFAESIFGGASLFEEIGQAQADCLTSLADGTTSPFDGFAEMVEAPRQFDEAVDRAASALDKVFDPIASHFGTATESALSGGFDSRLILAQMRKRGIDLHLHVYGPPNSDDVKIARTICDGEGLRLNHVDKSDWHQPLTAETVERNFLLFDGLPTDGIFDGGADLSTRLAKAEAGHLALNGGGGEVMRNFFYLPDRPLTVDQVVGAFYRRYHSGQLGPRLDTRSFQAGLAAKWANIMGVERAGPVDRTRIELSYPLFRVRYWTSRNAGINNRLGLDLLPFAQPELVRMMVSTPLAYKNAGRLEAALIRRADPALAAYPSDYGFSFANSPPIGYRVTDWLNRQRPIGLRRYAYTIRHRLGWLATGGMQSALPDEVSARIARGKHRLEGIFGPADQLDRGQARRLATLEYLLGWLEDRKDV